VQFADADVLARSPAASEPSTSRGIGKMRQNPEFYFKIMVVRLPMALLGGLAAFTLAIA
jgi:hypothetical protein